MWLLVVARVTKNLISGTRSIMEKWVEGKLNKAFVHFLSIFFHNLMIVQIGWHRRHCDEILKNHHIWQKIGKKWRNALFNLPSTHFSADSNSDFGYPFRRPLGIASESFGIIFDILPSDVHSLHMRCLHALHNGQKGFKNAAELKLIFSIFIQNSTLKAENSVV